MTAWVFLLLSVLGATERVEPPVGLAEAITAAATARPLQGSKERMAAVLVAIAWAESRYRIDAVGDGGQSVGVWQMSRAWHPPADLDGQALLAASLVERSFAVCRDNPLWERLGWFAAGGNGCRGVKASRWRMATATRLLREHPAE
jgi:hypothetical protein